MQRVGGCGGADAAPRRTAPLEADADGRLRHSALLARAEPCAYGEGIRTAAGIHAARRKYGAALSLRSVRKTYAEPACHHLRHRLYIRHLCRLPVAHACVLMSCFQHMQTRRLLAEDAWESAVDGSLNSNTWDPVAGRMAEEAPLMQASASIEIIDRLLQTELDSADRRRFQRLVRQRQYACPPASLHRCPLLCLSCLCCCWVLG